MECACRGVLQAGAGYSRCVATADEINELLAARIDDETGMLVETVFLDRVVQALGLAQRAAQASAVAVIEPYPRDHEAYVTYARALMRAAGSRARGTDAFGVLGDDRIGVLLPMVKPGFAETIFHRLLSGAAEECASAGAPHVTALAAFATGTSATTTAGDLLAGVCEDLASQQPPE